MPTQPLRGLVMHLSPLTLLIGLLGLKELFVTKQSIRVVMATNVLLAVKLPIS